MTGTSACAHTVGQTLVVGVLHLGSHSVLQQSCEGGQAIPPICRWGNERSAWLDDGLMEMFLI